MAEVIVVHGFAGSGKTTQCKRVVSEGLGKATVQHISIGDRLRDVRDQTTFSRHSGYINSSGASSPLPHSVVNDLIFEAIEEFDDYDYLLIDGYPRYKEAVGLFRDSLISRSHTLLGTVALNIDLRTSNSRLRSRGLRKGEAMEGGGLKSHVQNRYNKHAAITSQAIEALGAIAPVLAIEADGSEDAVHERFKHALGKLALKRHALV